MPALHARAAWPRCSGAAALALVESAGAPSAGMVECRRLEGFGARMRACFSSFSGQIFHGQKDRKSQSTDKFLGHIPGSSWA